MPKQTETLCCCAEELRGLSLAATLNINLEKRENTLKTAKQNERVFSIVKIRKSLLHVVFRLHISQQAEENERI